MIASCSKKYLYSFSVGLAIFVAFFVLVSPSFSQELTPPEPTPPGDVETPTGPTRPEIYDRAKAIQIAQEEKGGPGGCKSVEACDAFCDSPENNKTCMDWALAKGVISQENHKKYSGFAASGGPGGCKTTDSCKNHCDDPDNFDQ